MEVHFIVKTLFEFNVLFMGTSHLDIGSVRQEFAKVSVPSTFILDELESKLILFISIRKIRVIFNDGVAAEHCQSKKLSTNGQVRLFPHQ